MVRVDPVGDGMRVSGQVIADFDCDSAPPAGKLESGQIMGLRIDVQLFDLTPVLERGKSGQVNDVRIDPRSPGTPVPGQVVECRTSGTISEGGPEFGIAEFALPTLPRPLAPGIYSLAAKLTFLSQGRVQLQQIKWCSGLWGAEDMGFDPLRQNRVVFPVLGDTQRHARFFEEITTVARKVEASVRIYMTERMDRPQRQSSGVVWCQLAQRIAAVTDLETHSGLADKDLNDMMTNAERQARELAILRQTTPGANLADLLRHWREMTKTLKDGSAAGLVMMGGPAEPAEKEYLERVTAARADALEQIRQFQDDLTLRYWELLDGALHFGYHRINRPGRAVYEAVRNNDAEIDARERNELQAKHNSVSERLEQIRETFKHQPPSVIEAALDYNRIWPFKTDFLSRNFIARDRARLELDVAKWRAYRAEWMKRVIADSDRLLAQIDTSATYANTAWPQAAEDTRSARDALLCIGHAYEWHIRTAFNDLEGDAKDEWLKDRSAAILAEWTAEAARKPDFDMMTYVKGSLRTPMAVYLDYRQKAAAVRSTIKVDAFAAAWKAAMQAGKPRPGEPTVR